MTAHQTIAAETTIETLTGAEIVVRALIDQGVEVLFGYPGGTIMPFYDALVDSSLKHILEQRDFEEGNTTRPGDFVIERAFVEK